MNKMERSCWTLKELEEIQRNLGKQRIDRRRVDIVPYCIGCGTRHGKFERLVIGNDGWFYCLPRFLKLMGPDLAQKEFEGCLVPYPYDQPIYPIFRYCGYFIQEGNISDVS
jgi:hypothetical protein